MRTTAEKIVDDILDDMTGLKGLDYAWDEIDPDIRDEIRTRWVLLVARRVHQALFDG